MGHLALHHSSSFLVHLSLSLRACVCVCLWDCVRACSFSLGSLLSICAERRIYLQSLHIFTVSFTPTHKFTVSSLICLPLFCGSWIQNVSASFARLTCHVKRVNLC